MRKRAISLREAWHQTLREHGARLLFLVTDLNGDSREQREEHWRRLAPGVKGLDWKLPNWPNVFPAFARISDSTSKEPERTLLEEIAASREHLRRFMDSWFAAGQDYRNWSRNNAELVKALDEASRRGAFNYQARHEDGSVEARPVVDLTGAADTALTQAAFSFGYYFLQNQLRDVLAGRCKRCLRYFFNRKGYEQMVYCTQRCRWASEKDKSRQKTQGKLEAAASEAMRKLAAGLPLALKKRRPTRNSWKEWVVSQVNKKFKINLCPKWLTRSINNPDGKHHKQFVRLERDIERLIHTGEKHE